VATRTASDASVRLGELLARLGARRLDARRTVALARRYGDAARQPHGSAEPAGISLVSRVADILVRLALDQSWRRSDVGKIAETLALIARLPVDFVRLELQARVARDPRIIELSPPVAIETELKVFYALTQVAHVSLWSKSSVEGLRCVFHAGPGKPGRRARLVARAVLEGSGVQSSGGLHGTPVLRWQRPDAALVLESSDERAEVAVAAARETSAALALVLEREALLVRSASRERALVETGERLLARLGFDLHDGPIQDVAALAGDIHLFRRQLEGVLSSTGAPQGLVGRVDDLEARVVAVDRSLRQMVHSLESPTVARRPLDEALRGEIEAFQAQTEIPVELVLRGEFGDLTDSQRIAILRIVQESLTNIREHSDGTEVTVSVMCGPTELAAEISDNGRGFDVERTLVRAARSGRLGLVGMSERARLLGGRFDVRSRRGGPTTISVLLPAWRPATVEARPEPAAAALSVG
jgi:signal transduction histidine kinase